MIETTKDPYSQHSLYKISGMDCQGCVKGLTRSIQGLAPHASVVVELEQGIVGVEGATEAQVIEATKQAGFEYNGRIEAA